MTDDVVLERRIAARPETVFAFLTDPVRFRLWMGVESELDPRPGGVYRVAVPQGVVAVGEFVEVDPPSRVVFTWGWEGNEAVPPGSTRVEITLRADGDATLLRLVHGGLVDDGEIAMHRLGWTRYLDRLVTAAAGGDPGPDRA